MKKDKSMKKSELAYIMAHLAQDLTAECASNEELTELVENQKITLKRYSENTAKLEDNAATWQHRYYEMEHKYNTLVSKVKAKCEAEGIDCVDLFAEDETDNYEEDTFGF